MKVRNDAVKTDLRANSSAAAKKTGEGQKPLTSRVGGDVLMDKLGSAKVDLSPRAQDIKKAKEIALNSSKDIDEAKVARLQALIDSGQYKVDSRQVADKLVDEQVKNAFFDSEE